jgi:hypothetical protein
VSGTPLSDGHLSPPSVALAEQNPGSTSRLRRSKSVFGTLSKKLRSRARAPSARHTPKDSPPPSPSPQTQLSRRQTTYRPQAVPVVLSDDPISRERREAALRSRGLRPSRQPRDLSAIEADADRRIDALRKSDSPLSSSATDSGHSDANEIAQTWRIRNSNWLTYTPRNSESPVDPMTEGCCSYTTYQRPLSLTLYVQALRYWIRQATPRDHRGHQQWALILPL